MEPDATREEKLAFEKLQQKAQGGKPFVSVRTTNNYLHRLGFKQCKTGMTKGAMLMDSSGNPWKEGEGTGTQSKKEQQILKRGTEAVLRERGLIAQGEKAPNADVCAQMLQSQPDFVEEVPKIELEMEMHGHKVLWNPKYHAELNPIEMMWGAMKRYMRAKLIPKSQWQL